jgi:ribosomal protein S24E
MSIDTSDSVWAQPWHSFNPVIKRRGVKIDRGPTRRDDERLLAWLAAREEGVPVKVIADEWGVTTNTVVGAVYRIKKEMDDE